MEIEKIDKNFLTERSIPENARIFDVRNDPFEINGVFFSGGHFVRMPEEDAKKVNPGVRELHACTAGGRVRFSTDSSFLAFIADMNSLFPASHTTFLLNAGFDIYRDNEYFKTVQPPLDYSLGMYTALVPTDGKMHSYTVVMPCYGGVRSLLIGVGDGAQLKSPVPFRDSAPVIYYGSRGLCLAPGADLSGAYITPPRQGLYQSGLFGKREGRGAYGALHKRIN